jgi:hypothetical protein
MISRSRIALRNWAAGGTTDRGTVIAALGIAALTGIVVATLAMVFEKSVAAREASTAVQVIGDASPICRGPLTTAEAPFYGEMATANARMHARMAIAPTGDVDRDFARMMIPHHQGAIDMALVQLKYGRDERLRRLAQAIVVEQGQEIAYMRSLLDPPAAETSEAEKIEEVAGK